MRRFFLGDNRVDGDVCRIEGDLFRHMVAVLRLSVGTHVTLIDTSGNTFEGEIKEIGAGFLVAGIASAQPSSPESNALRITLLQGLPKGEKMELVLQKGTELGISEFRPFIAERSVSRPEPKKMPEKVKRWERIVQEAARQCGAAIPPVIASPRPLRDALPVSTKALKLLLWEEENRRSLRDVVAGEAPEEVAVVVGPEGGITPAEAALALEMGYIPVSLGMRILRTETAGLAVASILQFVWGDLG